MGYALKFFIATNRFNRD